MQRWVISAALLVLASSFSTLGDVLFAFFWNAKLLLSNPSLGLGALGVVGIVGILVGVAVAPAAARITRQARFLALGSATRACAVASIALVSFIRPDYVIAAAIGVQFVDIVITLLTAGAITILLSEVTPKGAFTRVFGLNRTGSSTAAIGGWVVGGILFVLFSASSVLLACAASLVPVTLVFLFWSKKQVTLVKSPSKPIEQQTRGLFRAIMGLVVPFAGLVILGSLVSRTSPLLWSSVFPSQGSSIALVFGLLFGFYTASYLAAGLVVATPWVASRIDSSKDTRVLIILPTTAMGASIAILPFLTNPFLFLTDNVITGFTAGIIVPIYASRARQLYDGVSQKGAFYYMGILGRYGESVGSAIAGLILIGLTIGDLYVASGIGVIVVTLVGLSILRPRQADPQT